MLVTETRTWRDEHAKFCSQQSADAPIWLQELRDRGLNQFQELGLPTTRDEEWRFTNIAPAVTHPFTIADVTASSDAQIDQLIQLTQLDEDFHQLVFVNGRFAKHWSRLRDLPAHVIVQSLAESIGQRPDTIEDRFSDPGDVQPSAFVALNAAFVGDGAHIHVSDGVSVDRPIHLIFVSSADTPTFCHPHNIVTVGKNSRATLIESYVGCQGARYFTNTVTNIELRESAKLSHHKLQHEQSNALHVATTSVYQQAHSRFHSHYFSFGGDLTRNELKCTLDGEHIECTLNGLYLPTGNQLMDCRTEIHHAKPNCRSHELYKGILNDRAKGVFSGRIHVYPDAQKTDAKQSNQAILLSDDAVIDTKPQLEIYADDVRCTHGATVGELDEQAIYYLRSRGIPADLARTMLIFAFANDVVQGVEVPAVRHHLESILLSEQGLPNV